MLLLDFQLVYLLLLIIYISLLTTEEKWNIIETISCFVLSLLLFIISIMRSYLISYKELKKRDVYIYLYSFILHKIDV